MSTMASTTLIVTTVTKTANKKKTPKEADAAPKANIIDFCEEHYEDILLVIMDKIRRDKSKEFHARLVFRENPRKSRRVREGSQNSSVGTLPARAKRRKPTYEEDLSIPWTCEDVYPFTPRIRNFKSSRKTRMPNNVKTYDGIGDPKDHLKIFQAATQFDELPLESIDGYKGLKVAFLAYFMQQKKYVKYPVEIHKIKQRDGETIEEVMKRFKIKT
nr:hypothetical protein [Tanacetum cinerariifolium]